MNILFLTFGKIYNIEENTIYCDLIREFIKHGHSVCTLSPGADSLERQSTCIRQEFVDLDIVRGGNNLIKKGLSTILVDNKYLEAIKKKYNDQKFDLVIYTTPPITLYKTVKYVKKKDNAKSYLLLKDIFPQNAVDIGMMTQSGPKSIIYKLFKKKEEKLYKLSDYIGCMSQANVDFIVNNNSFVDPCKVHVNPNSIEVKDFEKDNEKKQEIYSKYNIPKDTVTFIYGGNLGKPQDIPFIIECLKANADKRDRYFVICGTGTEYPKLKVYVDECKPNNVLLINGLPKAEYEDFVKAFDIGLIFLDNRFTIPNFPSRILSYMQAKMPVLACTDSHTDIGKVIEDGGFGWQCESDTPNHFTEAVDKAVESDLSILGENGYKYLKENYTVQNSYDIIIKNIEG